MDDRSASAHFEPYRKQFSAREPSLDRMRNEDELTAVTDREDVSQLVEAPAETWIAGEPPSQGGEQGINKHLWLIGLINVSYALEEGETGKSLARGRLSHTNLSGGADAFCGGELWFRDDKAIWLNGGSSRYMPRSAEELEAVVAAYRRAGYKVADCGWSDERNEPARFFRGTPRWE